MPVPTKITPRQRQGKKPAVRNGVRATVPLQASPWTPMDGRPTTPGQVKGLQQNLMGQNIMVGRTGADGDYGAGTKAGLEEFWTKDRPSPIQLNDQKTYLPAQVAATPTAPGFAPEIEGAPEGESLLPARVESSANQQQAGMQQQLVRRAGFNPTGPRNNLVSPVAQPASAVVSDSPAAGAFRRGAGALTRAAVNNPMATLNAGLGVAGLIMNATTKDPTVPAYQDFQAPLRAARGMDPAARAAAEQQIESSQRQAGEAVTADANQTVAARLFAGRQAGAQRAQLAVQDQQIRRADEDRLDNQRLSIDQMNHQGRAQQRLQVFDNAARAAAGRRAGGTALAQGALTYGAQAEAGVRQQRETAKQQQSTQLEGQYQRYKEMRSMETDPAKQALIDKRLEEIEAQAATITPGRMTTSTTTTVRRARGGTVPAPVIFRRGGSVSSKSETTSTTTGSRSVADPAQRLQAQFAQQMSKITTTAQLLLGRTVNEILKHRSRPLSPSGPGLGK